MAEASADVVVSAERKRPSKERGIDDYKRKIWKLKKELEEQRELSLAVQKEELGKLAQSLLLEKEEALEALKLETRKDLLQMRTAFTEKEAELSRAAKRQEDECRSLRLQVAGHAGEVKGVKDAIESAHHDTVSKLQREIKQLKHLNQDLQQKYQVKQQDYRDKVSEMKTFQEEAESERQKLLKDALTVKLNRLKRDQDTPGNLTKERDLQHKVTELTVGLKRMEKRSESLKEENVNLRKTETSYRDLEEQCAKLKRRNAELANTVKSTGEKHKQLQVSTKKSAESADTAAGLDHAKKLFARQRAKDFAEHSKVLLNKDKEIERLTRKNLGLSDSISNRTRNLAVKQQLDMSTALRQGTKERMVIEMKSGGPSADDSESKATLFNMQVDYDTLLDRYDTLLDAKVKLEQELEEFRNRLGEIEQELGGVKQERTTLQDECEAKDKRCVQLTATNNNVIKERDHLSDTVDKLTEEISVLKHENKSCRRTVEKLSERNKELGKSLEVRDSDQRQHLESNIAKLTDQLQTTKAKLKVVSSEAVQLREDNSVASDRITELLDLNQSLKSELNELNNSAIPTILEQSEALKTTIKQLELKNEDLREEKEELVTQCNDQEDITALYETVRLDNLSLTEELSEVREQLEKEQKSYSKTKHEHEDRLGDLTSKLQQANEERTELEQNRSEAQRRIEAIKTDYKEVLTAKDAEIELLEQEKEELKTQLSNGDSELEQLRTELSEAEEQIAALQADLSRELSTHNNELESFERLQERLNTTSEQVKQVDLARQQLEEKLIVLEAVKRNNEMDIDKFKQANETSEHSLREFKQANETLEHSLREFKQENEQKSEQLLEATQELEKRELDLGANSSMKSDLQTLEYEMQSLISEKADLAELVTLRETEKQALSSQIGNLARDLENLQSTHLESSNLANAKQSQYETAKQQRDELSARVSELVTELEKKKHSLSEAKKQETHAKKKLISLKHDLTTSYEEKINSLNRTVELAERSSKDLQAQLTVAREDLEEQSMNQISVYTGENCYHLYVARHAYDPSIHNDGNESVSSSPAKSCDRSGADSALSATEKIPDISVNPGDYVFVSGELTEEGYYEGNLLDGRAGLIPSNVLEPLYEFDIYGFVVASEPEEVHDESGREMSEFSSTMFNDSNLLPSTPRPLAPHPRNLSLDRQLSNGILVGWDSPEGRLVLTT